MPATEDSVLTSLNELRRLRKERQKKGHSGRSAARAHKPAAPAHDPSDDQVTPPPRSDFGQFPQAAQGHNGKRNGSGLQMGISPTAAHAHAPVAATWDMPVDTAALAQMAKPSSSAKPAIIVAILLLGAAGAGYMKLQSDTQALIAEKDAAIRRVEDARVQAVESSAKAERQAQLKLKACETKAEAASASGATRASVASATTPSAVVAPAAPVAAALTHSSPANSRSRQHHSSGGRRSASAAAASAPAPTPAASAVPNLPGKKKLADDPLAGIKI